MMTHAISIGLIGARGHVGAEMIRLIGGHPRFELAFVSSREWAGQALAAQHPHAGVDASLCFEALDADAAAARAADAVILALPNGLAAPFVAAIDAGRPQTIVLDLSADYRFDDSWYYGLPELTRAHAAGQRRISNPGCYATAMQLALAPLCDVLDGPAQCFGVSGYSGAGTTPGPRNDPEALRDNLMPYSLVGHLHEREVTRQLDHPVEFMPHVAPHFRGLTITANAHLSQPLTLDEVRQRYQRHYGTERLVRIVDGAPWVSRIAGRHHVEIGGFTLAADGRRLVVVATEDNLMKGAATQALQNLNLAFGLEELAGLDV
jgi:N-acetyl-gamma-glutamyl-phosphate reductase